MASPAPAAPFVGGPSDAESSQGSTPIPAGEGPPPEPPPSPGPPGGDVPDSSVQDPAKPDSSVQDPAKPDSSVPGSAKPKSEGKQGPRLSKANTVGLCMDPEDVVSVALVKANDAICTICKKVVKCSEEYTNYKVSTSFFSNNHKQITKHKVRNSQYCRHRECYNMQTVMRKISGNFDVDTLAYVEANKDLHRTWWQENAGMPTNMGTLVEAKFMETKTEKRKFIAEQRGVPKTEVRKYCFSQN
jgi:hypothetical protein